MSGKFHLGVASALAGAAVGGAAVYAWQQNQRYLDQDIKSNHPALKHGIPLTSHLRFFSSYVAEYDTRLRNPKYVLEHFSRQELKGNGTRNNSMFKEDPEIDPRFRASLEDFRNSGYDRGHMAPAANHKRSQEALNQTFYLTNVSPQVGIGFNRDYWARVERFVQELADRCSDVYVVTGPCYLPLPKNSTTAESTHNLPPTWSMNHDMLGNPPRMVAVPTHFYKVILGENSDKNGDTVVGAFVLPNAPIDADTPLAAFTVPISSLEEVTGISFFPKFLKEEKRRALDHVSIRWQEHGRAIMTERKKLTEGSNGSQPHVLLLPSTVPTTMYASSNDVKVSNVPVKPGSPGYGMEHICEDGGCRLPAEKWWEAKKNDTTKLRRTQSLPNRRHTHSN